MDIDYRYPGTWFHMDIDYRYPGTKDHKDILGSRDKERTAGRGLVCPDTNLLN